MPIGVRPAGGVACARGAPKVKTDLPLTRRGWLAAVGGFAGVGALAGFAGKHLFGRSLAAPLPPLVLPPGIGPLRAQRLNGLHLRYETTKAARGAAAMRGQIIADLRGFVGHSSWQELIVDWIGYSEWNSAADLLVDAAENGEVDLRRSCAVHLSTRGSPLLTANGYGARVVRLHTIETDAYTKDRWFDLRRTLGV